MTAQPSPTQFVTPPCRIAFPSLFEKRPNMKGSDKSSYQAVILVPPSVPIAPFHEAIKAAMLEHWGKLEKLTGRSNPIAKAESINSFNIEELAGFKVIRAKSGYQPGVVDQRTQPILDAEAIASGYWCRFQLTAWCWDNNYGKGVSFNLDAVQLVREDERLDGRRNAADVFEPIATADAGAADDDDLLG